MTDAQFVALAVSLGVHIEIVESTERLTDLLSEPVNRMFALLVPEMQCDSIGTSVRNKSHSDPRLPILSHRSVA